MALITEGIIFTVKRNSARIAITPIATVTTADSATPIATVTPDSWIAYPISFALTVEITRRIIIAIKSCTIKKPIEIRPYKTSISCLSERSFIIMIVLLKANPIARYKDVVVLKPIDFEIKKPITVVNMTWPTPVISETVPTSLMTLGLRFKPTKNNSKAIPMWENVESVSTEVTTLKTSGPASTPLII